MEKDAKKARAPRKKAENINNTISEEVVVIQENSEIQVPKNKTLKEIYEQYAIDRSPYKIYLRGQLIFNSVNHKNNPIFFDDYFILFGNKYIYKGIRFEKY